MPRSKPPYFDKIRRKATETWEQLEANPDLAYPWRTLFEQVKSPRHVLSELVQNADDAGATEVSVRIINDDFVFEHNGEDFTEEDFDSLCSFCRSNKRNLSTIGFRGIGFRSIFALGDSVDVMTPTLACRFTESRFMQPIWVKDARSCDNTRIVVEIGDDARKDLLKEEINRWASSSIPILFFRSISRLRLEKTSIRISRKSRGPCTTSERVELSGPASSDLIVFKSLPEPFPSKCLEEIKQERGAHDLEFPPCEIVFALGGRARSRLYVVLPTDVELALPVSIHAPFLQDPARTGLKHPSTSPTNHWLLERAGKFLAQCMLEWLSNEELSLEDRAAAYKLMPKRLPPEHDSLTDDCSHRIVETFEREIDSHPILLCADGTLGRRGDVACLPKVLLDAWGAEEARGIFCPDQANVLAAEVSSTARTALESWDLLEQVSRESILSRFETNDPVPRPRRLDRLVALWSFLVNTVNICRKRQCWRFRNWWSEASVVPVEGSGYLMNAQGLVVTTSAPTHLPRRDWEFITQHLRIVDKKWNRLIKDMEAKITAPSQMITRKRTADQVPADVMAAWEKTELSRTLQMHDLITLAASKVFSAEPLNQDSAIALVQIAARLNVRLRDPTDCTIRFLCSDGKWRNRGSRLTVHDPAMDELLPESWLSSHAVSELYEHGLDSGRVKEWRTWLFDRNKGCISRFPLPKEDTELIFSKKKLHNECIRRGGTIPELRLKRHNFTLHDWDWEPALVTHWEALDKANCDVWSRVVAAVLSDWGEEWSSTVTARATQEGWQYSYRLGTGPLRTSWIERLQSKACLLDDDGRPRQPSELLRRTPEAEALIGVDSFVKSSWDKDDYSNLFDALGVRSTPAGVESLLDRVRALAGTDDPPLPELHKLYRGVDRVADRMPNADRQELKTVFIKEPLILTQLGWQKLSVVFLSNPHDIDGVPVIHRDLRDGLGLWQKLGVTGEPSVESAMEWMKTLPRGMDLPESTFEAVRALMAKYSSVVWAKTGCWLNLERQLVSTADLKWSTHDDKIMQTLFPNLRKSTADFCRMESLYVGKRPRDKFPPLIEDHVRQKVTAAQTIDGPDSEPATQWIQPLGALLFQVVSHKAGHAERDMAAARRLSRTTWCPCTFINVRWELDGTPASEEHQSHVAWDDNGLYVSGNPMALFDEIVEEVSRPFSHPAVPTITGACLMRSRQWIEDYALQKFGGRTSDLLSAKSMQDARDSTKSQPTETGSADQDPADSGAVIELDISEVNRDSIIMGLIPPMPHRTASRPKRSTNDTVMDYFKSLGFAEQAPGHELRHPDGRILRKSEGLFRWSLAVDEDERPIWVATRSLDDSNGLELPAEVWEAAKGMKALLLEPNGNSFREHDFSDLRTRIARDELNIFASAYRIRLRV